MVYSKDEATNFNADIGHNNNQRSFDFKNKLLGNTEADGNNRILKNAIIALLLEYLHNVWRSLEMLLLNRKSELKLKWRKSYFLSAVGAGNNDAKSSNIIYTKSLL